MGLFSKIGSGLKKTRDSLAGALGAMLGGFTRIDDELFGELEEILITSDVGVATSSHICELLKIRVREQKITDPGEIRGLIAEIIAEILGEAQPLNISTKPSVILVMGVNGAGKTTTIGKLAMQLKNAGKQVILAAADTFRAAAIEQLEVWAERAKVDIIKNKEGTDPAAVIYDTITAAGARGSDIIICDTAGRLHNKKHLMDELAKIFRVVEKRLPDCDREVLLVLDASTGQNALNQAREFIAAAPVTGIILTKLDGTARGGVVIGIANELKIPVKYIGVGEQIDDLQPFNSEEFAAALFE